MKHILKTIHVYLFSILVTYRVSKRAVCPRTHDLSSRYANSMPKLKNVHITLILLYKQDSCLINSVGV